jgi:predicted DNA-binding transcriptional regulator AlpA
MVELLGLSELAALLGVSRQRADQLARQKGFPEPFATLRGGRLWLKEDVERWAHETGRLSNRRHLPPSVKWPRGWPRRHRSVGLVELVAPRPWPSSHLPQGELWRASGEELHRAMSIPRSVGAERCRAAQGREASS